ncbi:gephyrin-like molybdotransferase Glp [Georgenia sp. MJ206]|uniref:molybdopterin molybdotransferase MoeA n=1 Tax=Georgenia wangjunii TaxID=3117730 RepID=UPI002F264B87
MITVEQYIDRVLAGVRPLTPHRVALADAHGCVLAEDVVARLAVPPFDNSAMDGYAVRAADVAAAADRPVRLPVTADVPAGATGAVTVEPGTAVRVMTGAPVPAGADAVVPVEHTDQPAGPGAGKALPAVVEIRTAPSPGRHVRRRGDDVAPGATVLRAGTRLGAQHLSAAASAGHGDVLVHPRVRVGVLATGAELVPPGAPLAHGQIPDSNSTLVLGLVREAGAVPVPLGVADDEPESLRQVLAAGLTGVDAVITTGGVSAGAYDVVKEVLEPLGDVAFTAVAMQPGKPQGFGVLAAPDGRAVPIFCLPGNPVSVYVSVHVLVRPALTRMAGTRAPERTLPAVAAVGWGCPPGRRQYIPVVLEPREDPAGAVTLHVRPAAPGGSGSHLVASLARAEALAVVEADVPAVAAGDAVRVMMVP